MIPAGPSITEASPMGAKPHAQYSGQGDSHSFPSAILVLAGNVRQSELAATIKRSLLDLPLPNSKTLLEQIAHSTEERGDMPLRVIVDRSSVLPAPDPLGRWTIEREPASLRGTGGVLRDSTREYDADALIGVINGPQIIRSGLMPVFSEMCRLAREAQADVVLLVDAGDVLDGTMVIRPKALEELQEEGYVDFKEQALRHISRKHSVAVLKSGERHGLQVRTLTDYLEALRTISNGNESQSDGALAAFDPTRNNQFALTEEGAEVSPKAYLSDSIVLKGGIVEAGATIVRSLVGPGGVVRAGTTVVDRLIGEGRRA